MKQISEVHSDIVGGSTSERLLSCPGSWQATAALPRSLTSRTSEYAEEGTAMHAVMTELMGRRAAQATTAPEALLGRQFHDRVLTQAHIDTMIGPALECLAEMEQAYGGNFTVVGVEKSVRFPGIPGAFGTCDLILQSPVVVLHVDWKFGAGVGVSALYRDPDGGERVNAQLMFYLTGAMHTHRRLYGDNRGLVVAVIQPRAERPLTVVTVSRKEVRWFREDLERAVAAALTRDAPRHRGEHCRFAPCKTTCPLWTGPLLDLSALGVAPPPPAPSREHTDYGDYLAYAKALVDIVSGLKSEIDAQLHAYLEAGGHVPGWRLKAKRKDRQWVSRDVVEPALEALGFKQHEIWRSELVTFGKADATAKRLGVKIPEHLRVAPPTNETTLAPTDDPAPVVDKALALEQFGAALTEWNARNALQKDCDAPISN